jgi:hypothetical protein
MQQANYGFVLGPSGNYGPGATGATAGPSRDQAPITNVLVTQGAARVLDYYDNGGNRLIINLGTVTTATMLPITLTATGSTLTPNAFYGFTLGRPY